MSLSCIPGFGFLMTASLECRPEPYQQVLLVLNIANIFNLYVICMSMFSLLLVIDVVSH